MAIDPADRCCPSMTRCEDCPFKAAQQDPAQAADAQDQNDAQTRTDTMEHRNKTSTTSETHLPTPHSCCRTGRIEAAVLLMTAGLALLLVGACNQPASPSAVATGKADNQQSSAQPAAAIQTPSRNQAAPPEQQVIAYYFHRTLRCATCLAIEKQSKEAVENHFKGPLLEGRLQWQAVNFQLPENTHFEKDFQLQAQALVLVKMKQGKVASWKNLPKVWDLVDDPGKFDQYVRTELAAFLGS
jgi:hypothetical protein